ncbi:DUF5058 family protein [Clostridium sp. Cult2]|uniref:DUF5058 family protein n=1 Tax=Clostridium sp. Cult2 TaxID=2079003 RepID=UPI001F307566|nr:DUF5058 family protein [Clostridium sp. Cult2]MCF6465740.1 DUF5058 domain-containing protein [Clostridium sp. Cult2]
MKDYLEIANDPMLWVMAIPAVAMVGIQAYLFSKRAFNASRTTSLTKEQCRKAFKVGAVSAIGPSLSVFVVMIAMMAVIGGPVTWLRLSFIGAAPTELTASTIGAKAMGVEFGSPEYDVTAFASSVWTMTLNGCGWLIFCGLFTHKLDRLQDKVAGGDTVLMGQICGAAILGTASYLVMSNSKAGFDRFVAALVAAIAMIILDKVSDKLPKLKEYNLGISMIVGMFIAVLI